MFNEHTVQIGRILCHGFCWGYSWCSWTPSTGWGCSCLSLSVLWCFEETTDFLQRIALGLLSLLCSYYKQGSRRTWKFMSTGVAWSQWLTAWACESLAPLPPGGTKPVLSFMPQSGLQNQTVAGTFWNLHLPWLLSPVLFPHSFTISPGNGSWIKEELNQLGHMSPCLRLCF